MFWFFDKKEEIKKEVIKEKKSSSVFSTDFQISNEANLLDSLAMTFKRSASMDGENKNGMDAQISYNSDNSFAYSSIPQTQLMWFASQGFIGYQSCAMIAQHWLVDKACTIPAKDCIRKGWEVTVNNGVDVDVEVMDKFRAYDVDYKVVKNLVEFVKMGRVFGIRIAMFKVISTDPLYYEKPYNPDGIVKGSYKGISQIDPYWCTPILDDLSLSDPSAIDFYEPTYWFISGKKIHKSHLIIMRTSEVADILKPSYLYGGIPVPQKIYERVYASERTANEAPQLVLTKRTNIYKTDAAAAMANQAKTEERLQQQAYYQDNYAIRMIDKENDDVVQLDTALGDLDSVIMTQYQLVAAVANVPATKLLGTTPKGFNSTGEYEESNYREELESIQMHDLTPLLQRHYEILIRSEISPLNPFDVTVVFNPIDSPTENEVADINLKKAQIDTALSSIGAIDGMDVRDRLIKDTKSGYSGISNESLEDETEIETI